MKKSPIGLALCLAALFTAGGCNNNDDHSSNNDPVIAPDIIQRAAQFVPKDLSHSPLQAGLTDPERAIVDKLVQAAAYLDAAFWQQVDPDGEKIFREWANATTPEKQAAHHLMDANYGRWDRFREFAPFVGTQPRPAGGYVYPADLTKAELDAYLTAHPEQKTDLLNPYTVVRRNGNQLIAVPYHQVYADFVLPAATLLDEAAALSQNASLAHYLRLQAEGLRTDDYYAADLAWLDLDGNLDVSIGPHETYDDQLTGQKTFYKVNVLIVDQSAAGQFAQYKAMIPQLQANLPVDPKYKPDQTGTLTPMILADDVRRAGQARSIMEGVAFSLPNDPRVQAAKGSKKVMMGNYLSARRTTVLEPLAHAILDPSAARLMEANAYFTWVLMHEITHTLGPRTVVKNGQTLTVREAMGQYYSPIEEGKADIGGLYNLPYLMERGVVTGSLAAHYVGYLAEALRSIRFGMGSAYGVIRSSAWNFLTDQGALRYDPDQQRFLLDVDKMTVAVKDLLVKLITIEGEGNTQAAADFIAAYSPVRPELKKLLDQAETTVPLEFVPVYPK